MLLGRLALLHVSEREPDFLPASYVGLLRAEEPAMWMELGKIDLANGARREARASFARAITAKAGLAAALMWVVTCCSSSTMRNARKGREFFVKLVRRLEPRRYRRTRCKRTHSL